MTEPMGSELHVCEPPMEQRSTSDPTGWRCPECEAWWDIEPGVPPQVAPAFDFMTHQGIVPAKWIRRENG
jgi:hypothetical protein